MLSRPCLENGHSALKMDLGHSSMSELRSHEGAHPRLSMVCVGAVGVEERGPASWPPPGGGEKSLGLEMPRLTNGVI